MASLVTDKTDLQKDIESNAGVIPIYPWTKTNREGQNIRATKDKMVPNTYARMLLEGKSEQRHQEGRIRLCDSGFSTNGLCPYNSQFWRSNESDRTLVPSGWVTYNNDGGFTMCPLCRSHDLGNLDTIDNEYRTELDRERDGVDASTGHSGSTSSGNNKSLPPHTYSRPRNTSKRKREQPSSKELLKKAGELFKGKIAPDRLKRLEKEIKKEERDKRAKAAESRKRRKTSGGKRRRKKTRKKRGGVIVNGVDIALNPFDKPFKNNLNNQYIGKYFRFTTKNDVGEVFEYDGRLMGFTRDGKPRFVSPSVPGGQIAPGWQQFVQIWMYKADTDAEKYILSFIFGPQQGGRRRKKRTRRRRKSRRKSRRRMRGKRKGKSRRKKRR